MFGTDTAKRDLLLIALGILAAAFFYWFYPMVHPLNLADSSLGNRDAATSIISEFNRLGYSQEDHALTTYRVNSDVINFVQTVFTESDIERYRGNGVVRRLFPAFYWHSQIKMQQGERYENQQVSQNSNRLISVSVNEQGRLLSLQNPSNLFPQRLIELSFFEDNYPSYVPQIQQLGPDSLMFDSMKFQMIGNNNTRDSITIDGDEILLSSEMASQMAKYHLQQSGWPSEYFTRSSIEPVVVNNVEVGRIQFSGELPELDSYAMQVTLEILPGGTLLNMNYELTGPDFLWNQSWSDIHVGIMVVTIFLITIWLLVLFFIRIRLRLIDIKLSVLIAVIAGFAFPLLFLMNRIFEILYTYTEFSVQDSFGIFLSLGFMAAISSLVFFVTTAVSDSITRENWVEKLKTFDLVRIARVYNRPVGLVFIRATAYSFILLSVMSIVFYLLPDSYIQVSEVFRSDTTLLPSLEVIIYSILVYLLIVQVVMMIAAGKLVSIIKRPAWILFLVTFFFLLLNYLPINVGPWYTDLTLLGLTGIATGLIYLKEDFLTTFFSMTLFGIHLLSSSGWVMDGSPDASVFYVSILLTFALLILGAIGFYKGEPVEELPNYVPEYINELKRDERIKQELQIARKVQQSFLPGKMPVSQGFEIAAVCNPALETGGDYYDFIEMNDHQLAVTIGDVSGKGIEAAFYMTFTKGVLHALCGDIVSTSEMLTRINNLFLRNARKGTFISLIFGIIDFSDNSFRFSRGGHNPLLHFCSDSGKLREYRPSGIGLGMANEATFSKNISESAIEMKKGDFIVLFTDGVVEATNSRGKFYGDKRLHSILKRSSKLSAEKIIAAISTDLYNFGEGSEPHDDMTAIVIKKT